VHNILLGTLLPVEDKDRFRVPASLAQLVRADLASMAELKQARFPSIAGLVDVLLLPGTWAVLLFRVSNALHRFGLRPLSRLVYFANCVLFGADLAPTADVGGGLALPHPVGVAFSPVRMGERVRLMGGVRLGGGGYDDTTRDGLPTIGDDCYVFDGAKVFGKVTIGDRVVIGTNSVVSRDVPSDVIVLGNPARVVKHRGEPPHD
jgi:serine O-acetyltransferase